MISSARTMMRISLLIFLFTLAALAQQSPAPSYDEKTTSPSSTAQQQSPPQEPPPSSNAGTSPTAPAQPSKDGVYRVGNGVTPPVPIKMPDPKYTEEARQAKYQGTVLLWMIVTPDGRPKDIKVTHPIGHGLTEKAIEAARKWRFKPATLNGHPVAVQINIQMNFRLY